MNRIDEIVVFHPLGEEQIAEIAKIQLKALEARLAKLEIRLDVSDAALKAVAAAGFDPVYGARPLKRAIQQQIENPLAKEILAGKLRRRRHRQGRRHRRRDHVREGLNTGCNGAAPAPRRGAVPDISSTVSNRPRSSGANIDASHVAMRPRRGGLTARW